MTLGGSGSKLIRKIVTTNLRKWERPVSYKHVLWKLLGQLVKNKSMQLGFSAFSFNVGYFTMLFSLKRVQNEVTDGSETSALKSPIIRKWSDLSLEASNCFWSCRRWFSVKDLLGLYVQQSNHFLLLILTSIIASDATNERQKTCWKVFISLFLF